MNMATAVEVQLSSKIIANFGSFFEVNFNPDANIVECEQLI